MGRSFGLVKALGVSMTVVTLGAVGLAAPVPAGAGTAAAAVGTDSPPRTTAVSAAAVTSSCVAPITNWPLSQRLEQLLMVSGQYSDLGASATPAASGVGGFVFFGQPAAGTATAIRTGLTGLVNDARGAGQVVPWMSTDEEGGNVARLANVIGALPSARQMGTTWTAAQIQSGLAAHGAAMRSLGMTMDLAPVLDTASPTDTVASENTRSFSANPSVVATDGVAYANGLRSAGIVPVGKHFPGLGHADANTDDGPATDPPLSQLESDDLIPFERAVTAGLPVVMVSHVRVPGLTGSVPASLSPATYRLLRSLHFSGVALTDALGAGAVSAAGYGEASAAVAAIRAGADMAMIDAADWRATVTALQAAVSNGSLSLGAVDTSVARILAAKGVHTCSTAGMAVGPSGAGYWLAGMGGVVQSFGSAPAYGSVPGHLNAPIVGIAATTDRRGYWLVASDGGIFGFGDAVFRGSMGGRHLNAPIVGMAATSDAGGYWLAAVDGGIFAFGDARFYGSGA